MHDKAAYCRRQAQETRAVAEWLSLTDDRRKLLDGAKRLEALAAIEERQGQQDRSFALACQSEEDPLLQRTADVIAEAPRLQAAHRQFQTRVNQQVERMRQIEAELDPLLPHPY
jgi:hypothetical protein